MTAGLKGSQDGFSVSVGGECVKGGWREMEGSGDACKSY